MRNEFLRKAKSFLTGIFRYGTPFQPKVIYLEVSVACNRRCPYCPVSIDPKKQEHMDESVLNLVIGDLQKHHFNGEVCFHFYNEPLLVKELEEIVYKVHQSLPKATLVLYTNGDLLTENRFKALLQSGVGRFVISRHPPYKSEWDYRILSLLANYPDLIETFPSDNSKWHNRGGLMTDLPGELLFKGATSCRYPEGVNIRHNGDVVLCCNDYHGKHVFGNVLKEPLMEIYFSKKFTNLRRRLRKGQFDLEICRKCVGKE